MKALKNQFSALRTIYETRKNCTQLCNQFEHICFNSQTFHSREVDYSAKCAAVLTHVTIINRKNLKS